MDTKKDFLKDIKAGTHPYDDRGYCNACQWLEEKKIMDWKPREGDVILPKINTQ